MVCWMESDCCCCPPLTPPAVHYGTGACQCFPRYFGRAADLGLARSCWLLSVIAVSALLRYVNGVVNARLQTGFVRGLRTRLHDRLLRAPWEEVKALRSHDISASAHLECDQLTGRYRC